MKDTQWRSRYWQNGTEGMKQQGFYLEMEYATQGRRWRHVAGPFPCPDDAFDATVDERDFEWGYRGCTLLLVAIQGYPVALAHPRSQHARELIEWQAAQVGMVA